MDDRVITIPVLSDNYAYLLVCRKTAQAAVIDPSEAGPVIEAINKEGLNLKIILATHRHFDHIGGVGELSSQFKDAQVVAHKLDAKGIGEGTRSVQDGDSLQVGQLSGTVIHTPGHTRGAACYLFGNKLFTGDTLFLSGCGRLFEGTPEQMYNSLNKLAELPPGTLIYCGHEYSTKNLAFAKFLEPRNKDLLKKIEEVNNKLKSGMPTVPSTMEEELKYNPFLRFKSPELIEILKQSLPDLSNDPLEIFARTRELKDSF